MANPARDARDKAQAAWPGAAVFARGRNWIKHQHPTEPDRFVLDAGVGSMHYGAGADQEIDTAWEPSVLAPWLWQMVSAGFNVYAGPGTTDFDAGQIVRYVHPESGEDITFQPQQLQWTNDIDQIEAVADPQVVAHTSIDDDTIHWLGAYGAGIDFRWQAQTSKLAKYLTIQSLAAIGSPSQFIIDGGNPVLRVPFIFQKSSDIDIYIDGVLWNELGNNPQTTSGNVEFRLSTTDESLWWFKSPTVKNNSKDAPPLVQQRFRKQGASLFVEVLVPWSWLETASYPVEIDPTIDEQVGASTDDAHENNGAMTLDASTYNIFQSTHWVGARFTGVALDGTETINSATSTSWYTSSFLDIELEVSAEDTDDAATFGSGNNDISGRTQTTARYAWSATATSGGFSESGDISAIIQEIIDRGGWSSGNDIALLYQWQTGCDVVVTFYDGSSSNAPKLHIDYTAGGAGALSVSVSESVTIGESAAVTLPDALAASVSESVTVGESITARLESFVSVSESVTIAEVVAVVLPDALTADVNDAVTIGEEATVTLPDALAASVSESVTIAESVTVALPDALALAVSDGVTINESVTVEAARTISVSESVTIGESSSVVLPDALEVSATEVVTIGESVNVSIAAAGAFSISVSDSVTIGEAVSLSMADLEASVSESVTIGESVAVTVSAEGVLSINVSESVTIAESVTLAMSTMEVSVTDAATIGESVTVSLIAIGTLTVSVSESVTIGEVVAVAPLALPGISASEAVTIGESVIVSPPEATALTVSVSDALTVGESVAITPLALPGINVSDSVAIGEISTISIVIIGVIAGFGSVTSAGNVGAVRSPFSEGDIISPSNVGKIKVDRHG